jgi:hypothetical protein
MADILAESRLIVAKLLLGRAAPTPGKQIAENRPDADADGEGLIGMFMHGLVGRTRAINGFLADAAIHFPSAVQRGGETLAGFGDFLSGHIGGGIHQGARIIGERGHVMV